MYATVAETEAAAGEGYLNPGLFFDNAPYMGLHFADNGARALIYDGAWEEVVVPCSTNAWHFVQMRWDGINLELRVDGGSWNPITCGTIGAMSGEIRSGYTYTGTNFFTGQIAEIITINETWDNGTFNNIKSYLNDRYSLSL